MTIDTTHINETMYRPTQESPGFPPPSESLLGSAVQWLSHSLNTDPLTLFVRAGDRFELAGHATDGCDYTLAAGGPLERQLSRRTGRVPIDWSRQNAYILGEPCDPEESCILAALGAGSLLGLHAGGHLDGFLCIGKHAAERRDWEMEVAREVQNRIFPAARPRIAGLDYYSDWRPAQGLSGDYLDYFEMAEGNLGLVVGEVAAKGWPAALLTSCLHSVARALRYSECRSLSDWVAAMDELFYEVSPDHTYATLFVARYNPACGLLHYVNAGHEAPLLLRKTGAGYRTLLLESNNPVVGMLRKAPFRESVVPLGPGDLLVASTDGLCGATSPRGEEWGFRRLLETVQASSYRKARDIVDRVLGAAEAFTAGCPQYDDMTLWLCRVEQAHRGERPRQAGREIAMAA